MRIGRFIRTHPDEIESALGDIRENNIVLCSRPERLVFARPFARNFAGYGGRHGKLAKPRRASSKRVKVKRFGATRSIG